VLKALHVSSTTRYGSRSGEHDNKKKEMKKEEEGKKKEEKRGKEELCLLFVTPPLSTATLWNVPIAVRQVTQRGRISLEKAKKEGEKRRGRGEKEGTPSDRSLGPAPCFPCSFSWRPNAGSQLTDDEDW